MLKKGAGDKYIACAASIFEKMDGFAAATFWKQTPTGRRERLGAGSKCAVCRRNGYRTHSTGLTDANLFQASSSAAWYAADAPFLLQTAH